MWKQICPQLDMLLPRVVKNVFIYCCEYSTIKTSFPILGSQGSQQVVSNSKIEQIGSKIKRKVDKLKRLTGISFCAA